MRKIRKSIVTLYPFNLFKFTYMKKRIIQFLTTYFLFVLLFVLQKPIFMVYYHDLYTNVSLGDYFRVMWHGLPLDLSLAGYLTAIPGILLIASAWTNSSILRRIRQFSDSNTVQNNQNHTLHIQHLPFLLVCLII